MQKKTYSVSIIVPALNEAGTISTLIKRVPQLGAWTEIIFVEGFSTDGTWDAILKEVNKKQKKNIIVRGFKQEKLRGKKPAVELGFSKAKGDILVILDADLSVAPETLEEFVTPLMSKEAQFVNGSRFIYPQEDEAMRFLNTIGNRFFARVFSVLLQEKVTDTLCGTKALFRKDWKRIQTATKTFAHHDPYGDFQLFLGAGLLKLHIKEVPVKYYARIYGKTKISRFKGGFSLLIIVFHAWYVLFLKRVMQS